MRASASLSHMFLGILLAQLLMFARVSVQEKDFPLTETLPWRVADQTGCSAVKDGLTYVGNDLNDGCLTALPTFHDCCIYCSKFPSAVGFTWHREDNDMCPKGCWCKTRLNESSTTKASATSASISRGLHWLVPAHAFGVYHGWLPGGVDNPQDPSQKVEGSLHMFARAVAHEDKYLVRGFAYFWSLAGLKERTGAKYANPQATLFWQPKVYAQCNNRPGKDPVRFPFLWVHPATQSYNMFFEGVIVASQSSNCRLHVSDWESSWGLTAVLGAARKVPPDHVPLRVYTVFGQGYGNLDVDETERRMRVHIEYHRKLGCRGLWSYSREAGLEVHSRVARRYPDYVTAIHWGDFPVVGVNNYDQGVIHNHALLSASFSNTYLFLSDLDEFLATNAPATVNQMVDTCMRSKGVSLGLVQCMDVLYVQDGGKDGKQSTPKTPDVKLWPRDDLGPEVLRNYSLLAPPVVEHWKGLAKPEDVVRYFVHDGQLRGNLRQEKVAVECMYCVHMRNVVTVRRRDVGSFKPSLPWQWVLDT